jgi:hypothetical protein
MAVCRAAWIAVVLELVTQCALVESQATNFAAGGRQSYEQPESQGGVVTRTDGGPPYRDINDAVRSGRTYACKAALTLPGVRLLCSSQKRALLWVVLSCFGIGVFFACYCMCSQGNGQCKWCRENVEGGVVACLIVASAVTFIVVLCVWIWG